MRKEVASLPHHNYLTKIQRIWASGQLPRSAGYHQLSGEHDDWCGIYHRAAL